MQEVGGCERVVESPMVRLVIESQPRGERGQLAVRHLVTQQSPCQRRCVDDHRAVVRSVIAGEGCAQEAKVERGVMGDEY